MYCSSLLTCMLYKTHTTLRLKTDAYLEMSVHTLLPEPATAGLEDHTETMMAHLRVSRQSCCSCAVVEQLR